ncbi:glycoside hydrolase domain-containing protein [Lacticaseibacillus paracasei]|uniref:glycoside hydrolase domain-containing protein n=1 Tax=Lacticaseibacillus paracasei TaxID=1597 RepID=UPI0040465A62
MADEAVRAVQKWLNKTYGSVPGFVAAPENGQTGWPTIYSLRMGLQHEIGISAIGEGFGDTTKNALAPVVGSLKPGYKGNIAQLIQGAFWCKGISPVDFNNEFTNNTLNAVKELQQDAGIAADGSVTVAFMAALFDMAAFVLVSSGDAKVRTMQQALNRKFSGELQELMPCDGIYQRATNTALIYALQRAIGMSSAQANGNYGPGTIAATPTVNQGANSDVVQVIQYGLYVNGFYTGAFDGYFSSDVATAVVAFRKFMNLPPFNSTADLTVIKGLLTSNGNTNRDSNTFDTATQLSAAQAKQLKQFDFSIVARYLTGSVGAGAAERDKYLTSTELANLTEAGLKVVPIYEDGGYELDYFSLQQGIHDGFVASSTAAKLGFPAATTIYFAVDVDVQSGDIDGTIIPYFRGISQAMNNSIFKIGIYGTRNVCNRVTAASGTNILYSYVADMSYGGSGNLGFKMPKNWAFDQFVEYSAAGVDIDQVASSEKDQGSGTFKVDPNAVRLEFARTLINNAYQLKPLQPDIPTLEVDGPEIHVSTILAEFYIKLSSTFASNDSGAPLGFTISNGKLGTQVQSEIDKFKEAHEAARNFDFTALLGTLGPMIGNGNLKVGMSTKNGMLGFKVVCESTTTVVTNGQQENVTTSLSIEIYTKPNGLGIPAEDYKPIYVPVSEHEPNLEWIPWAAGAVVLIATIIMAPEVAATLVGTAAKLLPATFIAA